MVNCLRPSPQPNQQAVTVKRRVATSLAGPTAGNPGEPEQMGASPGAAGRDDRRDFS